MNIFTVILDATNLGRHICGSTYAIRHQSGLIPNRSEVGYLQGAKCIDEQQIVRLQIAMNDRLWCHVVQVCNALQKKNKRNIYK